jgi:Flp pilus assembly protein TadG
MKRSIVGRGWRGFARERRGGVALVTALVLPPLLLVGLGAVELNTVLSDKRITQDVADSAALLGAEQIVVDPTGAASRAQAWAAAQLAPVGARAQLTVTATPIGVTGIKIAVDTHRDSFFGNIFPPGGFFTHVEATAAVANSTPLCVLNIGAGASDQIAMTQTSSLTAPKCMVHSDSAVAVASTASLSAFAVEAATTASGPISPSPNTSAPRVGDPFAGVNVNFPVPCGAKTAAQTYNGDTTLPAGMHTSDISIGGSAIVTLAPGEHYFCGTITIAGSAQLTGDDVVLVFDTGASLVVSKGGSTISLNGRKSGTLAGFVMVVNRNNTNTFTLASDHFTNLTGVVYSPTATLVVDGSGSGAASSAWTVVAARSLQMINGPQLVINANYTGSSVPVPMGVGPRRPVRITQ